MSQKTIFSRALTKARESAGFANAYRFYHDCGGLRVFRYSYRTYLSMEAGEFLPVFDKLRTLVLALGMIPHSAPANELIRAWLRTMVGEEGYRDFMEPLFGGAAQDPIPSPLHKAIRSSLAQKKFHISPEQLGVIVGDRETYLCFLLLSNDSGRLTAVEIASAAGIGLPAAKRALARLAAIKVVKRAGGDAYSCRLAGAMVEFPHAGTIPQIAGKLKTVQQGLIASGQKVYSRWGLIRADAAEFSNFYPLLSLNISTAQTYARTRKTGKTAIFAVEGRVTKIMDF